MWLVRLLRWRRALALLVLALAAAAWWWRWNARPEVQVPAAFERLAEAVAGNDAAAVVACLHPDYDWQGQWPELYDRQDQLRAALGNRPEHASARGLAQAGLRRLFALHVLNRLELSWRITAQEPRPDGSVQVVIDLGLDAPGRSPVSISPPARGLGFVLKPYGLAGRYRILRHDPLPIPRLELGG